MVLTLAALLLSGCKSRAVEEAREVIAVADSLRAEGQGYTDSVVIAESYNTLEKWQYLYPTDYVHACYYYGRLLRNNDDPVAAMEVFINGTHSRTKDYHILGRIYSNMGSISHLAGEYQLSYDMYSRSADLFLQNGDTLLYYYLLNDMAVELAVQGEKEGTLSLITEIQQHCSDSDVMLHICETKAEMYRIVEMYDSAIYWINEASKFGDIGSYGTIIKAQAFDNLCLEDSARLYAECILSDTTAPYHAKFNALYIISHNDSTLSKDSALILASAREDIRHYEYEPEKEKLTIVVQILQDDLIRKPNLMWLYAIIGTLVVVGIVATIYVERKRRRRQLLSQQISDLEHITKETAEDMLVQLKNRCAMFRSSTHLKEDLCWNNYEKLCVVINQQFYLLALKLQQLEEINERDVRLCALVLLDLSHATIADLMCVEESSVGKLKERTARKLKTSRKNMRQVLINIILGDN